MTGGGPWPPWPWPRVAPGLVDGDGSLTVAGQVAVPAIGLPWPGVTGPTWAAKQAATTTPLPSALVDTSLFIPNEPQFRFMNDCCRRIAMNVNRLLAASGWGSTP